MQVYKGNEILIKVYGYTNRGIYKIYGYLSNLIID